MTTPAQSSSLASLGPGRYLSYGAYPQPNGSFEFASGVWLAGTTVFSASVGGMGGVGADVVTAGIAGASIPSAGKLMPLDISAIREDATHAWLSDTAGPRHPMEGITQPDIDKAGAYT